MLQRWLCFSPAISHKIGLGNSRTFHELCGIERDKSPTLVFLMETKVNLSKMNKVKQQLSFDGCFSVDALGQKGGLALLWKHEEQVTIINYSQRHISVQIEDVLTKKSWMLASFYREPKTSKRSIAAWLFLQALKPPLPTPWMAFSDFNEILFQGEKIREVTLQTFHEQL